MLTIKVLGSGCASCKKLERIVRQAIGSTGLNAEVIKVTDYAEMMQYNILSTPGLVINDKLVASDRVPLEKEMITFLADAEAEKA